MLPLLKIAFFLILNRAFFPIAYGQDCAPPDCFPNPVTSGTFGELISKLALIITKVSLPLIVLFLILAGIMFVTARGNEEKLARAKRLMWWTIIGAALVVGAWAIAIAIDNFGKALG